MPCKDNTRTCGVAGAVNLRVVRVSQGLCEEIPITLIGGDVMTKAGHDQLIKGIYLSASLWVESIRCPVLCTKYTVCRFQ